MGKIRNVLFKEVSLVVGVIGVTIGVVLFITRADSAMVQDIALIRKDIQIIRENELKHIKEDIQSNKVGYIKLSGKIQVIDKKLDKVLFVLEELNK